MGPPDIRVDGVPIVTDTRKAIALLAYLSQRDTAPSRDHLVDLLWPDSGPERGRGALRRTVSTLRTALGGRWVEADRERIELDRTHIWLDTDAIAAGGPDTLDMFRGRFLEGFWVRGAPDFENWQLATAEHYDQVVRQWLADAVDEALASGDHRRAIDYGERLVALDPIDESGHRALMIAYASGGDRGAATRQFRRCAAILEVELGVEPLPTTVDLHEEILSGARVVDRPPPLPAGPAAPPADPPLLLGRELELEMLRSLAAGPGVVAVSGPVGSGRSRLVAEALPEAVTVRARPGEREIPHSLTRSLLDAALAHGDPSNITEAAGPAGHIHSGIAAATEAPPSLDGDLGPVRLRAGVAAAVAGLIGAEVIIIDDLDLADPASVETVDYLSARATDLGIRLVLVTDLPHDRMVNLGPLPPAAIAELIGDSGLEVAGVAATTGGLPGLLHEVLSDRSPVEALDRLRARRIAELDPVERQVLEGLVVLGSSEPALVATVTGRGADEVAQAMDRLVAGGMASFDDGVRVTTWANHVTLERLGPARLALLHSRAADALAGRTNAESAFARAWHLHRAGRREESAQAHADAGRRAAALHAHDTARVHLHAALAAGHTEPGAINRALGDVERSAGRYSAAIAAYHAAAAYGTDTALERAIGDVYRRWGRWMLADTALIAAESIASPSQLPLVIADRAEVAFRSGDRAVAADLVARATELLGDDPQVATRVLNVAGLILDGTTQLETALATARQAGLHDEEAAALNNLALAWLRRGEPEIALDHACRSLALLERSGDRHRRAAIHGNLADIHHARGDESKSRDHLRLAVELFAEVGIEPGGWEPEIWKLTSW